MLYSCPVDADYLDTENFMSSPKPARARPDNGWTAEKVEPIYRKWSHPQEPGISAAVQFLSACQRQGKQAARPFIPYRFFLQARGKTVQRHWHLRFRVAGVKKAIWTRVILAIPYTSIIDQAVDVFSEILGQKMFWNTIQGWTTLLKEDDGPAAYRKETLAAENWGYSGGEVYHIRYNSLNRFAATILAMP